MKHFHLLMIALTLAFFAYSSFAILTNKAVSKAYMAVSHTVFALTILTGLHLFVILSRVAGVQHWAIAKVVLLVVAISAIIKARRKPNTARVGIFIVWVCMAGILFLAVAKPVL